MERLDKELNRAGSSGFELCGWTDVDKTLGFNGFVAVMKRPGKRRSAPDGWKGNNEGWYPDPYEPHEQRHWSGYYWTEHVSDGGEASIDVPGG